MCMWFLADSETVDEEHLRLTCSMPQKFTCGGKHEGRGLSEQEPLSRKQKNQDFFNCFASFVPCCNS